MAELSPTARAARREREHRHKKECFLALVAGALLGCVIGVCVMTWMIVRDNTPWHTETPPVEARLQVVTYGWYDKKGVWRSYDNGEEITVKQWQPLQ